MPDNEHILERPIQVLLNTKQFMERPERPPGGGKKDFYWKQDAAFRKHKMAIRQDLDDAVASIANTGLDEGFLVVQMREEALAKSHRPLRAMFTPRNRIPLIGGGGVGEMYFQCSTRSLRNLANLVDTKAEEVSRSKINKRTGKEEANPSYFRSDLGAIENIRAYSASDRVRFSAREAAHWIGRENILGGYIIELFHPDTSNFPVEAKLLFLHLQHTLQNIDGGLIVRPLISKKPESLIQPTLTLSLQLTSNPDQRSITFFGQDEGVPIRDIIPDTDINRHSLLLQQLAEEPLVKNVELPFEIETSPLEAQSSNAFYAQVSLPMSGTEYPVVGVIDGGVTKCDQLAPWCSGAAEYVKEDDQEYHHGTFIAGLLAGGRQLNPSMSETLEPIPCKIYDIALMPRSGLLSQYYGDQGDFLDQLEEEIIEAKAQSGARIFNISLGMPTARASSSYTSFAAALDRIAIEQNVIFVVSAGNLKSNQARPPWPDNPQDAISMVASSSPQDDRVTAPGEQLLGLTVGAVNPPNVVGHIEDTPTCYTRRGPGVAGTRKPDLAHYGGATNTGAGTGLRSLGIDGSVLENSGTSFAAPNVAASLAAIDFALAGTATRETLLALMVHRATRSKGMQAKALQHLARDFVGYGRPQHSEEALVDSHSSVTLIFSEALKPQNELLFNFVWPQSMVTDTGKCRGRVELTLVYSPPIDPNYDDECLRIQLEAQLQQLTINPVTGEEKPKGQLQLFDSSLPSGLNFTENYMLKSGLKWTPVKRYLLNMPQGRGASSTWRLRLSGLARAQQMFPIDGVPFSIIMTISDIEGEAPVYDELRNELIRTGARLENIAVAHRIRPQN